MPKRLTYQYSIGSESLVDYRRNRDLTKRLRDNSTIAVPEFNGIFVYRPTDWLEATFEGVVGKEFAIQEESQVQLPSGDVVFPPKRRASAVIDQAFVRVHTITAPFEFAIGRRNYEDERHWLYDTSLDIASIAARWGRFRIEAFGGRETWVDLDIAPGIQQPRDRIDTYVVYADYRLENVRLAAYQIARNDRAGLEGHPRLYGVRAIGSTSERFNYWVELAHLAGKDENGRRFEGNGFDVGFTYRWTGVRHLPSVTLGYAFGSGDGNPNDNRNREFRQSGIQANETRFAGIAPFQIYGETFDPELSNLKLFTVAFGFRPMPLLSVDLVYHRYRLHRISDTFRSSALTAEINQIDTRMSKDLGQALDLVIGVRRLFGFRRLGVDLRTGLFFPGDAFLQNDGTDARPIIHHARRGVSVVTKIWW
jgi:alginate production protein